MRRKRDADGAGAAYNIEDILRVLEDDGWEGEIDIQVRDEGLLVGICASHIKYRLAITLLANACKDMSALFEKE